MASKWKNKKGGGGRVFVWDNSYLQSDNFSVQNLKLFANC